MVLKNQHTVPGAQAHTEVSLFNVVLQLFQLLLLRWQSAKRNALLLKMPHTTACVFVGFRSWEFCTSIATWGSRFVSIHGILEYNFPLKRYTVIRLTVTAFREHDLFCLPIDSLRWQLVEQQCQGRNIRMHLCVNWRKIRKFTFCIVNFDMELQRCIFRTPTVYLSICMYLVDKITKFQHARQTEHDRRF